MSREKILKREDRLLRNEKSWRRGRIGSAFFLLVFVAIYIVDKNEMCPVSIHITDDGRLDPKAILGFGLMTILFWWLIFDWLTLRINHIDTIKFYRNKLEEKKHEKNANT